MSKKWSSLRTNPESQKVFLDALRREKTLRHACKAVGIDRTHVWRVRQDNPEFDAQYKEVLLCVDEDLESSALKLAIEGYLEPIYHDGKMCGAKRRYPISLMIFLMRTRMPEKYGQAGDILNPQEFVAQAETFRAAALARATNGDGNGKEPTNGA